MVGAHHDTIVQHPPRFVAEGALHLGRRTPAFPLVLRQVPRHVHRVQGLHLDETLWFVQNVAPLYLEHEVADTNETVSTTSDHSCVLIRRRRPSG